ncbi:MAG: molybdopterin molybdenumtransferase MoeA, partial [Treponema sp.]|nr:molybdopterin molybdenumtransferase MoeA [Treponema sp.]
MKLLNVDTLEQAREKLWSKVKSWLLKTETISLDELSGNHILAEDFFASADIPSFRRATVDGYALIASDTAGAGEAVPVFLKQIGTVAMGKPVELSIRSGETVCVPTGGMLPGGADAVVMLEYTESSGETIAVYEAVAAGSGLAEAGEDICKG